VRGRRGRRHQQLLYDLKLKRGHWREIWKTLWTCSNTDCLRRRGVWCTEGSKGAGHPLQMMNKRTQIHYLIITLFYF